MKSGGAYSTRRKAALRRPSATPPGACCRWAASMRHCPPTATCHCANAAATTALRWRRWRRSAQKWMPQLRASAPTASASSSAPALRELRKAKRPCATFAASGKLPGDYHYGQQELASRGDDAGCRAGHVGAGIRALDRMRVQQQGAGQRRPPAQPGGLRRGDRRRRRLAVRLHRRRLRRARIGQRRRAAIRSAPTATASISAKARRCS